MKGDAMSDRPSVSVLVTVRNGLPYLESALRSIMDQTLKDIEIVVVDDASTDATPEVLARLAAEDPRIRVETLETNLRQAGASNRGLDLVRAPLVARMDADDLCSPNRLEHQKVYLDTHPDVVLLATSVRNISATGDILRSRSMPLDDFAMRWQMRFFNAVIHPSIMFRHEPPGGGPIRYDPDYVTAEDYKLALQLLERGKGVCLPDILVDYRRHKTQITQTVTPNRRDLGRDCARQMMRSAVPFEIVDDLERYYEMRYDKVMPTPELIGVVAGALRRMIRHDTKTRPDLRCWMMREAAMLLVHPLHHGVPLRTAVRMLARYAPDFFFHAGMRLLESRLDQPRLLRCLPNV